MGTGRQWRRFNPRHQPHAADLPRRFRRQTPSGAPPVVAGTLHAGLGYRTSTRNFSISRCDQTSARSRVSPGCGRPVKCFARPTHLISEVRRTAGTVKSWRAFSSGMKYQSDMRRQTNAAKTFKVQENGGAVHRDADSGVCCRADRERVLHLLLRLDNLY